MSNNEWSKFISNDNRVNPARWSPRVSTLGCLGRRPSRAFYCAMPNASPLNSDESPNIFKLASSRPGEVSTEVFGLESMKYRRQGRRNTEMRGIELREREGGRGRTGKRRGWWLDREYRRGYISEMKIEVEENPCSSRWLTNFSFAGWCIVYQAGCTRPKFNYALVISKLKGRKLGSGKRGCLLAPDRNLISRLSLSAESRPMWSQLDGIV